MGPLLFFLPNFPGAMFIQGVTFIPDSRVVYFYHNQTALITISKALLGKLTDFFCFLVQWVENRKKYFIFRCQLLHAITFS